MNSLEKKYLDFKFESSKYEIRNYGGSKWEGFFKDVASSDEGFECIVGIPISEEESSIWYANGQYFLNSPDLLNMGWNEFYELLKNYLNNKHDNLNIKRIV